MLLKMVLAWCLYFWGAQCLSAAPIKSLEEFQTEFLTLQKAGNKEGLKKMEYLVDCPKFILEINEKSMEDLVKAKIVSSEIKDIPAAQLEQMKKGFPYQGKMIIPNLAPIKMFKLKFEAKEGVTGTTKFIGFHEGAYYFLSSKFKEGELYVGPAEKQLLVGVTTLPLVGSKEKFKFIATVVYSANGIEMKHILNEESYNINVRGQFVKEVTVQNLSKNALYTLTVGSYENGKMVEVYKKSTSKNDEELRFVKE